MHIAILGLGHVGATTAACLARDGHHVLGVDPEPAVVRAVAAGRSPVREPGLAALLAQGVAAGRLEAAASALPWTERLELALICVGTPALPGGGLDPGQVAAATRELGRLVARRAHPPARPPLLVVVRSTVPPGTMEGLVPAGAGGRRRRGPGPALRGRLQSRVPAHGQCDPRPRPAAARGHRRAPAGAQPPPPGPARAAGRACVRGTVPHRRARQARLQRLARAQGGLRQRARPHRPGPGRRAHGLERDLTGRSRAQPGPGLPAPRHAVRRLLPA